MEHESDFHSCFGGCYDVSREFVASLQAGLGRPAGRSQRLERFRHDSVQMERRQLQQRHQLRHCHVSKSLEKHFVAFGYGFSSL